MNAILIDVGAPETARPLTCTRPLADCLVANQPLATAQNARLLQARLTVAETPVTAGKLELFQRGDAWISVAQLMMLALHTKPLALLAKDGIPLAWTGHNAAVSEPNVASLSADGGSFAIRYPWDLLRVNEELIGAITANDIQGELSPHAHVDGLLVLGHESRVLPGVFIEGHVVIGARCTIGPNCFLRGATAIGDGCHVGQAVEIKNSILMSRASVGHLSYIGDSILGEKVNFGAGTITANLRHDGHNHYSTVGVNLVDTGRRKFGVIVGDGVHTGIHTSFYPGRKLWPGVCTSPGEIVARDIIGN